mgnify:CR=1 FL=1
MSASTNANDFDANAMKAFNQQVIEEFRANGGKVTGMFANAPLVLVTTTGAKSGQPRTAPLVYTTDGDNIVWGQSGDALADWADDTVWGFWGASVGWTRVTRPYWGRQFLSVAGVLVTLGYLSTVAVALGTGAGLHIQPFWLAVTGVFVIERVVTVRLRGWRYMLAAATMYELVIDLFLQLVHAKAYTDAAFNKKKAW